ncbi:DEAD/DEAH box helicase [Aquabacterium sp.]|uniref:preprotein translocase subunit SecA n=1 Tax=Aquabacterium sp. TaxID=1872578 RepID=UPI00248A2F1C|nr:DEAD/DEAH box helicase [Aquabacterium sp.]MDI1258671.1 DEAD/DEAH box helicase [Aquabacterium sp.]
MDTDAHWLPPNIWSEQVSHRGLVPRPGPVFGNYPLRDLPLRSTSPMVAWAQSMLAAPAKPSPKQDKTLLNQIQRAEKTWGGLNSREFEERLATLRVRLSVSGFLPELVAEAFAVISLQVKRHLGFSLHDVQKQAAWWMLGNRLVEMATGEGKTLTVLLTAATAALAGVPVHVMTANDYLARRDATQLKPIYESLGLSVAWVMAASTPPERQKAYQQNVVHVTAREVAFDHLRDRAARAALDTPSIVLRGLCMAIVDEADSILIDEACTPLILSKQVSQREADQRYRLALFLARQLVQTRDFVLPGQGAVRLTEEGSTLLASLTKSLEGPWKLKRYREEQVCLGLSALHCFQRDVDYLVREEGIHIVDGNTGRLAVGRVWSRGLHQMIAIKEGLAPQAENETLTETTYQSFFPRYHALTGLSGTVFEGRTELMSVYGLPVVRAPLRLPSRRQVRATHVLGTADEKWQEVVRRAHAEAQAGRAVLIGTDKVADSDALSRAFAAADVAHQLLNARQDEASGEAEHAVIAAAGLPGAITVATHMAGRGTDIHLSPEVLQRGGLHVINTNLNPSRRIDRQLYGRAARQGMPGSCECVLSWEDEAVRPAMASGWQALVWRLGTQILRSRMLAVWLCRGAQQRKEGVSRHQRWSLLVNERLMARQLALAGRQDWD